MLLLQYQRKSNNFRLIEIEFLVMDLQLLFTKRNLKYQHYHPNSFASMEFLREIVLMKNCMRFQREFIRTEEMADAEELFLFLDMKKEDISLLRTDYYAFTA